LGVEHTRLLRWTVRAAEDRLADAKPGPGVPVHALLDWEREAIVKLADDWAEIDRSHRKLAHRRSRLELVHVSESTVWRGLVAAGIVLPAAAAREPRVMAPWPEWAALVPGVIFIYDFTHFRARRRCAVAVLDVVSRYWLSTVVSAEESSTQVEVAFTQALVADGKGYLFEDEQSLGELHAGVVPDNDERLPVLLAISDNGPQMTSKATAVFMAGARIAQHFGRPATTKHQAWIESFFGHLKGEFPHLDKIRDPRELERELDRCQVHYNTVPSRRHRLRHPRRRASRPRQGHQSRAPSRTERRPPAATCGQP
jgi:transposase InsO family protein